LCAHQYLTRKKPKILPAINHVKSVSICYRNPMVINPRPITTTM
jgi:hypothetical protein